MDTALPLKQLEEYLSLEILEKSIQDLGIEVFLKSFIELISKRLLQAQRLRDYRKVSQKLQTLQDAILKFDSTLTYKTYNSKEHGEHLISLSEQSLAIVEDIENSSELLVIVSESVTKLKQHSQTLKGYGKLLVGFSYFKEIEVPEIEKFKRRFKFFQTHDPEERLLKGLERFVKPVKDGIELSGDNLSNITLVRLESIFKLILEICKSFKKKSSGRNLKTLNSLYIPTTESMEHILSIIGKKDQHGIEIERLLQRTPRELEERKQRIQNWVSQRLADFDQVQDSTSI